MQEPITRGNPSVLQCKLEQIDLIQAVHDAQVCKDSRSIVSNNYSVTKISCRYHLNPVYFTFTHHITNSAS